MESSKNDTGWIGRSGGRCITDFSRNITFLYELTSDELEALRQELANDPKCPGWTGVICQESKGYSVGAGWMYVFHTTWDSSD